VTFSAKNLSRRRVPVASLTRPQRPEPTGFFLNAPASAGIPWADVNRRNIQKLPAQPSASCRPKSDPSPVWFRLRRLRITTSAGQGQARGGLSEGSPSAKVRADGQKSHRRLSSGASQHHMTKPAVSRSRANAAVVHRKRMFLFGESCATCGLCGDGSRIEAQAEKPGSAIEP